VLIAGGKRTFATANQASVKVKLNNTGKTLLKHTKKLKVTAKTTYAIVGRAAITATKTFTLK
jgi:hypothetical protein